MWILNLLENSVNQDQLASYKYSEKCTFIVHLLGRIQYFGDKYYCCYGNTTDNPNHAFYCKDFSSYFCVIWHINREGEIKESIR